MSSSSSTSPSPEARRAAMRGARPKFKGQRRGQSILQKIGRDLMIIFLSFVVSLEVSLRCQTQTSDYFRV
jgi:hypothetical protein